MPSLKSLATAYIQGQAVDPTLAEVDAFKGWVNGRFLRIAHIVDFISEDVSPARMEAHYRACRRLLVSTVNNSDNLWGETINARFRAVHDWDHLRWSCGYDLDGEVSAYCAAAADAPDSILWILYSEIVLQAAACIYTGRFNEQRLVRV